VKLVLKDPIELKDNEGKTTETITELTFREKVVAGDMRGIKLATFIELEAGDVIKITSRLTGKVEAVIAKLSILDLYKCTEVLGGFFFGGSSDPASSS
jgi:hypothetical protein